MLDSIKKDYYPSTQTIHVWHKKPTIDNKSQVNAGKHTIHESYGVLYCTFLLYSPWKGTWNLKMMISRNELDQ